MTTKEKILNEIWEEWTYQEKEYQRLEDEGNFSGAGCFLDEREALEDELYSQLVECCGSEVEAEALYKENRIQWNEQHF